MFKYMKRLVGWILRKAGYDIVKSTRNRKKLFDFFRINVVLDVGANTGLYAMDLRAAGYKGLIISFEPLSQAYSQLLKNMKKDVSWKSFNMALGDKNGEAAINIARNSFSSSILDMLPAHLQSAPESRYIGQEQIKISTIDSVFDSLCIEGQNIYLKIDTQGFEENVLRGAEKSLGFINTIQIEMSLIPLYRGELLFQDMYAFLSAKGYQLVSIELGFSDSQTGRLLQIDGIFHRF